MTQSSDWVKYPDTKPTEYYITLYRHPDHSELLVKALWYSHKDGMFQGHWDWAWEYGKEVTGIKGNVIRLIQYLPMDVREFIPASRNDYYMPCSMWQPKKFIDE